MDPNETSNEETELAPPDWMTSQLTWAERDLTGAEDEIARTEEALRLATRSARIAEAEQARAAAGFTIAKLSVEARREDIAAWKVRERKRLADAKIAEEKAASIAEQKAAEAASREPSEDEDEGGVEEPESARTLAGVELGNGLDTGFVVDTDGVW